MSRNSGGSDDEDNEFEREEEDTSVAPLETVDEQVKKEVKQAERALEAIEVLTGLLKDFLQDYENVEEINTEELEQIKERYDRREQELIEVVIDRQNQLQSLTNAYEQKSSDQEENESETQEPTRADDFEQEESKAPDPETIGEESSGLEDSVAELEQISEESSSVGTTRQNCFLKQDKIEKIERLIQQGLDQEELKKEVVKLGEYYVQVDEREELEVLIVGKKGTKKTCSFKIG